MYSNYTMPRLDKPESEKNTKQYHEDFARAIINRSITDGWRNDYQLMAECYSFLEEGSNGELVGHLQRAEDNTSLPAVWLSLNSIPTKIDLLTGELETRGYEIRVQALNKEAIARKTEQKERLRVKRRLRALFQTADAAAGFSQGESEYIPQTEEELNEYADLSLKDKFELIMTGALRWIAKRWSWDEERKVLFRDVLTSGRCFVGNDIVRGVPRSERVHPMHMIFDTSARKDDLSDATFFGELKYLPIASAAEKFNMSKQELEQVYNAYQQHLGVNPANEIIMSDANYAHSFNTIGGDRLRWFKQEDGELKVLVARAVWRDYKQLHYKDDKNKKYGTDHFQRLDEDSAQREKKKGKVTTKQIEMWRQCTIIGGHIVKDWGECPNQPRDVNSLATTTPPYTAWIPNYASGRGVSKVEQLASIQLYKDILMYNMQLAVIRTGAKGISYDLAMKPDTMTNEQVMKYLKVYGIAFYNSKDFQYLPGSNSSPFREYDLTMSDSVVRYVELMGYLDREMEKISGVSQERQGMVQGASQGLGVTQTALFQQNLITAPYFIGFERLCSRVLNQQAKLVKIAWAEGKEVFAPIIGDVGVDFLKEHYDLDLEDFAAFSESVPPLLQDRSRFESLVIAATQSDPDFIDEALVILLEPDIKVAVRKFQRRRIMRKIFAQQSAQAEQERAAALEEKLAQLDAEGREQEIRARLQETQMKNEAGMQKTVYTGEQRLASDEIKAQVELFKSKQQNQNTKNERSKKTTPKSKK